MVFKPGEKAKYQAPGEEEMSGNAQELFSKAQEAEKSGNISRAIKTYRTLVRRHPRDTLAPGAALPDGAVTGANPPVSQGGGKATTSLAEKFPKSERFDESIEAQFRIGEMYLAGKKGEDLRHSVQGLDG